MLKETDSILVAKLRDGIKLAESRPYFIGFLDEREAVVCEDILIREHYTDYLFWGGYEEAERRLLGLFPNYLAPDESVFPLSRFNFHFREADSLSHRDFLGSFMGLGVERDVIGDILVGKGTCTAFIRWEMESYFLQNIKKIGHTGVKISLNTDEPLQLKREFVEISGVVASPRLDCLVALLCHTSREKAAAMITSGLVTINHREILSVSERLNESDVLSVRKQGKFIIDKLGPFTSKGRLAVKCRKYK